MPKDAEREPWNRVQAGHGSSGTLRGGAPARKSLAEATEGHTKLLMRQNDRFPAGIPGGNFSSGNADCGEVVRRFRDDCGPSFRDDGAPCLKGLRWLILFVVMNVSAVKPTATMWSAAGFRPRGRGGGNCGRGGRGCLRRNPPGRAPQRDKMARTSRARAAAALGRNPSR